MTKGDTQFVDAQPISVWRDKLDALPIIYSWENVSDDRFIKGEVDGAVYVATREYTFEHGPVYHMLIRGNRSGRVQILVEMEAECGQAIVSRKEGKLHEYYFTAMAWDTPKASAANRLGRETIGQIIAKYKLDPDTEEIFWKSLERLDAITPGDLEAKQYAIIESALSVSGKYRTDFSKCLFEVCMLFAQQGLRIQSVLLKHGIW